MKLPEPEALTLCHLSTKHLRSLAASVELEVADDSRPALLASLKTTLPKESKQQWSIQDAEVSLSASMLHNTFHVARHRTDAMHISPPQITHHKQRCSPARQLHFKLQHAQHGLLSMQGAAPGRMKGLLVSHGNDLYLYGGMPHTAFTSARTLSSTSFAYPEGETIFMRLSQSTGSKWQSVSCEGAVPESRTRIHSGHAGKSVMRTAPNTLTNRLQSCTLSV